MLEALALKLGKGVATAIVIGGLFALGGVGFWLGLREISAMETRAAQTASDLRDAHWKAEIEKSNAAVERQRADQAIAAAKIETETGAEIARLRQSLSSLQARNAALPDGGKCGVGRARVRLLKAPR